MLCDRILGNLSDEYFSSLPRGRDRLEIHWWELDLRAMRITTHGGLLVRVLLPRGVFLNEGDVLFHDGAMLVVVRVHPCEVLVIRPIGARQMGVVALTLGNLHAPTEITGDEIRVAPDG